MVKISTKRILVLYAGHRGCHGMEAHAKMFSYKGQQVRVTAIRDITESTIAEGERERLINELQKMISEVKTLQGFLPICASCKKKRDYKGYWNQMESYISKHFGAQFSHGIYEERAEKQYDGQDWYKKK